MLEGAYGLYGVSATHCGEGRAHNTCSATWGFRERCPKNGAKGRGWDSSVRYWGLGKKPHLLRYGLRYTVEGIDLPEVRYFVKTFIPSFRLTLDELG